MLFRSTTVDNTSKSLGYNNVNETDDYTAKRTKWPRPNGTNNVTSRKQKNDLVTGEADLNSGRVYKVEEPEVSVLFGLYSLIVFGIIHRADSHKAVNTWSKIEWYTVCEILIQVTMKANRMQSIRNGSKMWHK